MSVPIGLPSNREDWLDEVNNRKLVGRTIHAADLASGSKIGYDQFLLLRVLWVSHKRVSVPERISDFLPSALELLAGCQSWKTYCDSFGTPKIPEGTFAMARHYQMKAANSKGNTRPDTFDTPIALRTRNMLKEQTTRVSRLHLDETPSKRSTNPPQTPVLPPSDDDSVLDDEEESPLLPSPITPAAQVPGELQKLMFPPTKDEQIVNTALLIFLSALTIHFDVSEMCEWTMHRKSFIPRFEGGSYEARTDGYLDDGQENAYALVEVKPVFRASKQTLIQMQESAQMVGWIKTDADEAKLRIHVSQDRHEIFLIFAEYDNDYLAYLKREKSKHDSPFLTMHQYGPWNTQSATDMREVGPILLAITLYAGSVIRSKQLRSDRSKRFR